MNDLHIETVDDFDHEIGLMRASHPAIEPLELDRAKVRAREGARRPRSGPWTRFARSRAAVVAAITAGALMSSGATALGISGLASDGSASTAQYGLAVPAQLGPAAAPGSGSSPGASNGSPGSGSLPADANGNPGQGVAPEEQAQQAGPPTQGQLPFTGVALIPLLLVGLALLAAGLLARRMAGRATDASPS